MSFEAWLRQYIQRHPVKEPAAAESSPFTARVMEQVRELPQPHSAPGRQPAAITWPNWLTLPSVSFALAAVVALVVVLNSRAAPGRVAKDVLEKAKVLAAFGDGEPSLENDIEVIVDDVDTGERLLRVAADQGSSDEAGWIEQMSQALDQLDDSAAPDTASDSAGSNWQDELEMLDDAAASSKS